MQTLIKPSEVVSGGIMRAAPQSSLMDVQLIAPHVNTAELEFVKGVLQVDLYMDMVVQQGISPCRYNPALGAIVPKFPNNADYEALWQAYLYELCATCCLFQALPFVAAQIGSNGVLIPQGINTVPAPVQQTRDMGDNLSRRIVLLQKEVTAYIEANSSGFPLYVLPKCGKNKGLFGDFGVILY